MAVFNWHMVVFGDSPDAAVAGEVGVLLSTLAVALFTSGITSGVLFLGGLLVSNWRHAIVAVIGATVADAPAQLWPASLVV